MSTPDNQQPKPRKQIYNNNNVNNEPSPLGSLFLTWMRVIPANDHLGSAGLFQHVQHLGLENGIYGLHGHSCTRLWHGEHIDDLHCVVVDKLT